MCAPSFAFAAPLAVAVALIPMQMPLAGLLAGTNYKLKLEVSGSGGSKKYYEAKVWGE